MAAPDFGGKTVDDAGMALQISLALLIQISTSPAEIRALQVFFTSVPLAFAGIHLLLFAFDTRFRRNLYFAILAASFAAVAFTDLHEELAGSLREGPLSILQWLAIPAMVLSVLRFVYDLFYERLPRQFWIFFAGGAVVFLLSFTRFEQAVLTGKILVLLSIAETFRVSITRWGERRGEVRIPAIGMAFFGLTGAADMLSDVGVLPPPFGLDDPYLVGGLVMLLSMSIHLAHSFASTRRDLEAHVERVQALSDTMLVQERAIRDQEISRRLIEADHQRKSSELEEARSLQVALLPSRFPSLERWEVAAVMKTATEVGGDYYDFHVADDGTLTVVIADAVGHGARSGIMVAAAKSLFSALAGQCDVQTMLVRMDEAVRGMGLRRMHIAMAAAQFRPGAVEIAAAAMPPALIRRVDGTVEEVELPGTPLGAWGGGYRSRSVSLAPGDLVLLMSDGLPELRVGSADPLGYDYALARLRDTAGASAEETVSRFEAKLEALLGGDPPQDDVTLLAVFCRS
jgi:serine phosphatase RsbU (regulator of sigma subunit)